MINNKNNDKIYKVVAILENKQLILNDKLNRIIKLKQGLYEDCKEGFITKQEYLDLKSEYEYSYKKYISDIADNKTQIADIKNSRFKDNTFITTFTKFGIIKEVTRDVIVSLIEEIIVYENRQIKIKYKYQDEYSKWVSLF